MKMVHWHVLSKVLQGCPFTFKKGPPENTLPTLEPVDDCASSHSPPKPSKGAKNKKLNVSASQAKGDATFVHPSVILKFPDFTDPRPDELSAGYGVAPK